MFLKFLFKNRTVLISLLAVPLGWWSERNYRSIHRPQQILPPKNLPHLSIIVPARNEEENLSRLLPSLNEIDYPGEYEIIVVDDNSRDQTAKIAELYNARLVQAGEPDPNCGGKQNASHKGALSASGKWLLFTDADTYHHPNGPAFAVSYAEQHYLHGLSTFLEQKFFGIQDHVVLATAYAGLFAGHNPNQGTLNGQYILLRSDVYHGCGGFLAVGDQLQDDLAFGDLLQKKGYNVPMINAQHLACVFMYDDVKDLWGGISRLGAGALKWSGMLSLLTVSFITILTLPVLALADFMKRKIGFAGVLLSWLSAVVAVLNWARRFGSGYSALAAPLGAVFVLCASTWGLLNQLVGRKINWKGRQV